MRNNKMKTKKMIRNCYRETVTLLLAQKLSLQKQFARVTFNIEYQKKTGVQNKILK